MSELCWLFVLGNYRNQKADWTGHQMPNAHLSSLSLPSPCSSDDTICVYTCSAGSTSTSDGMGVTASLTPLHRLRGHSSYITHLDWTADGQLLRSTCGAYELL